jgi:hypothetical protein
MGVIDMTDAPNPRFVARRLSFGTACFVLTMSEEPQILGCAEATAKRLARPALKYPALVNEHLTQSQHCLEYSLSPFGLEVKAEIEAAVRLAQ